MPVKFIGGGGVEKLSTAQRTCLHLHRTTHKIHNMIQVHRHLTELEITYYENRYQAWPHRLSMPH